MPCQTQAAHVFALKERMGQTQAEQGFRFTGEQIAFRTHIAHERHGKLFTQRVNGRIGHLRETLAEIVEEGPGSVVQRGERFVTAGRENRLLSLERHMAQRVHIASGALPNAWPGEIAACRRVRSIRFGREKIGGAQACPHLPAAVGMFAYYLPLQFGVGEQAVLDKVGHEHAARAQLTALRTGDGVRFFPREAHAAFRGKDQQSLPAEAVTARPQRVAIEHGSHAAETVGEHQGGGAVPCFHHGRVPVIEGALVVAHDKGPAKGFRQEHHQGMGQGSASAREQFQHVVQS